jgi:hypothetical protein
MVPVQYSLLAKLLEATVAQYFEVTDPDLFEG